MALFDVEGEQGVLRNVAALEVLIRRITVALRNQGGLHVYCSNHAS